MIDKNDDQKIIEELKEQYPGLSKAFSYQKEEAIGEDFYGLIKSASIDVLEIIKEKINFAIEEMFINDKEDNGTNKIFVLISEAVSTILGETYKDLLIDKQRILIDSKLAPGKIKVLLMTQDEHLYHENETTIHTPPSTEKSIKIINGMRNIYKKY